MDKSTNKVMSVSIKFDFRALKFQDSFYIFYIHTKATNFQFIIAEFKTLILPFCDL